MSKVSVVMSVYNGAAYLKDSVLSILRQTEDDFEFIIIDDGSTDGSHSILKEFADNDRRIKLVTRENKGLIFSLNEGISLAQSENIARMDADDIAYPDRLKKQLAYMDKYNVAICGTWAEAINEAGEKVRELIYSPDAHSIRIFTLQHNPYIHSSVLFKKDVFDKVGGYKNFLYAEDYELWTRIIYEYNAGTVPEVLMKYRIHSNQITKKYHKKMLYTGLIIRLLAFFRLLKSLPSYPVKYQAP
jgi:glycosyltransferase involved in cell wall biosynthesis